MNNTINTVPLNSYPGEYKVMVVSGFRSKASPVPGGSFPNINWTKTSEMPATNYTMVDPRRAKIVR